MIAPLWWMWDGASPSIGAVSRTYDLDGPNLTYCLNGPALSFELTGPDLAPHPLIGPADEEIDNIRLQPYELQ